MWSAKTFLPFLIFLCVFSFPTLTSSPLHSFSFLILSFPSLLCCFLRDIQARGILPWKQSMLGVRCVFLCDPPEQGKGKSGVLSQSCSGATGLGRQTGLGVWDHLLSIFACWQMIQPERSGYPDFDPFLEGQASTLFPTCLWAAALLLPFWRLSLSPGYHADPRKHSDMVPAGCGEGSCFYSW